MINKISRIRSETGGEKGQIFIMKVRAMIAQIGRLYCSV